MPIKQRTYVVCEGDSLYTIAKNFYGASEAGKKSTINMLFSTNRNILKSPDMLHIGQKLVIPPLPSKQSRKSSAENVSVNTTNPQNTQIAQTTETQERVAAGSNQTTTTQTRDYVVKSGDSLWKIAAMQLGNGSRYEEIAELNSDVLPDRESLTVGMHLKLPAR
jgi:nucleoid-associated protein YgaU